MLSISSGYDIPVRGTPAAAAMIPLAVSYSGEFRPHDLGFRPAAT